MSVQCLPPRPLQPGERFYMDVAREIEARDSLTITGWHFVQEPNRFRIQEIARDHERCDPSLLTARHIDTGKPASSGWTLFRRAA